MARRSPYGIKIDIMYGGNRDSHQIYLEKSTGTFTVEIEGEPIQDSNLQKVKERARLALKEAEKLGWEPVILLHGVRTGGGRFFSYDKSDHEASFTLNYCRRFMATAKDGKLIFRYYNDVPSPENAVGSLAWTNFNKRSDVAIPYTEKRWNSLMTIEGQVEALQEKFDLLMSSDKAEQLLEGTLRLKADHFEVPRLTEGKEKSDE